MSTFAKIDLSNTVINVIVADQDFINSGAVGDPSVWIQTYEDGSLRGKYASIGDVYNKDLDIFQNNT